MSDQPSRPALPGTAKRRPGARERRLPAAVSHPDGKSHRGPPLGNHNAVKHGFYSRAYRRGELGPAPPASLNPMQGEIYLFKILIGRIAAELKSAPEGSVSFSDHLYTLHTLTIAINGLCNFQQNPRWKIPDSDEAVRNWSQLMGIPEDQFRRDLENYAVTGSLDDPAADLENASLDDLKAEKLGFYAETFEPAELRRLSKSSLHSLSDEILLLRILIKRTVKSIKNEGWSNLAFIDKNRALRIIVLAGQCLYRLNRTLTTSLPKSSLLFSILQDALKEVDLKDVVTKS